MDVSWQRYGRRVVCIAVAAGMNASLASPIAHALLPEDASLHQLLQVKRPAAATWSRTQCGSALGDSDIPSRWADQVSASVTPLPAYPRPQMVRGTGSDMERLRDLGDARTWANLNGLWEWEKADSAVPRFGRPLQGSILVPFPVEGCLSGVAPRRTADVVKEMWYRLTFDAAAWTGKSLLHFGAVDWQTTVYLNGKLLGNHTGGFDGFSFDVTDALKAAGNELLVFVYDPSDEGDQPNGKQVIARIESCDGDVYSPNSGIWQTVWLERVPESYIESISVSQASETAVTVTAYLAGSTDGDAEVTVAVESNGEKLASAVGLAGQPLTIQVPRPRLWSPDDPFLYDLRVASADDAVLSYFGLRTFVLGSSAETGMRQPVLNGAYTFMIGFLDQSWWPDGIYTAPTDDALKYDLVATKEFGFNMIRLHQKVNPERWYYHADRIGLVVFQDMPQKYGHATDRLIPYFVEDLKRMIAGRGSHPSIVQWTAFNEEDCWKVFENAPAPHNLPGIAALVKALDPTRLVDFNSGGGANGLGLADVNDIHSYPVPADVQGTATQYGMVGEFAGLGAFIAGKEWLPGRCHTYLKTPTPAAMRDTYVGYARMLQARVGHVSAAVVTQTTDTECECDGFLNFDRSTKFSDSEAETLREANQAIINASRKSQLPSLSEIIVA